MQDQINNSVWVFNGARSQFPSGVFLTVATAEAWIAKNRLTGVLTEYVIDVGTYDWAVANGYFEPKRDDQKSSEFIGRFSSASQNHIHYENGVPWGESVRRQS
jgi:hypothetical protein